LVITRSHVVDLVSTKKALGPLPPPPNLILQSVNVSDNKVKTQMFNTVHFIYLML
jgi:hypothetical protein